MKLKFNRRFAASVVLSLGLVAALSPATAFGVTSSEKQAEAQSVAAQLNELNTELSVAVDDFNIANRNYEAATADVASCQTRIEEAQAKINSLQGRIGNRATSMYRSGSMSYLDVLMGVGSFDDFTTVWDTLNNLNEDDAELVVSSKQAKAELDAAKSELETKQAEAQAQLDSAASYKSEIESKTSQYESIYNGLSEEYQNLVAQEQAAEQEAAAAASAAYYPSAAAAAADTGGASSGGGSQVGGADAVSRAYSCIGLPYVYGAAGPDSFDCSGLVSYALTGSFGHAYVASDFWEMPEVSDPQPGDVVACHSGHCGLYIGGGQMIEAPHSGATVCISSVRGKIVRP
jgi:cell wall-associated NlpC family hydrolase